MGPKNAIIGDNQLPELPRTEVPQQDLSVEKKMAEFSRTAEFQRLKNYAEERIGFYQSYLPNGDPVIKDPSLSLSELGARWLASNIVIGEFRSLINAYEQASQIVREQAANDA